MIFPPSILRLRAGRVNLWLPIFLLWPLFAVVGLLVIPVLCLAARVAGSRLRDVSLLAGPALLALLCEIRGSSVQVRAQGADVFVSFV